ncbi:class I SAM-dependent methyltransferase [Roseovarius sp. A21]|uniref:Class I SAM-dependent methyltransferase n=1 Tax=Roseovarius bejariae TaxID=2576383 RepID=A0A844CW02_9RHOB|nr:SAM-dependent methyltransferase [Roseovarius bejariae]MRU14850.1 class I SAM-dependent methyltransferase [Roseovarius bejariae]
MSALREIIEARIGAEGPMPLSEYMALCLMHPEHGYYATRDPLGAKGDFTTAPEISQMFGELIGLTLAQAWMDQGAPGRFTLAELGPGRGTLMADALRATKAVPGFHAAMSVHLVETSPALRAVQAEALTGMDVTWHESVEDVPDAPLYLIANEFFDALPVRQVERAEGDKWRERCVGLQDGALTLGLSEASPLPALAHRLEDTRPGDVVEFSPPALAVAATLGAKVKSRGGVAVIVDYGDWRSLGDTFQALRDHEPAPPFAHPGAADLTAHVDFEALALAAPCAHSRLTPQGVFLERLGITQRAQALANGLKDEALRHHIAAHRRLTHPQEMGTLFKAMALYPEGAAPPPGFEA